MNFNELQPSYDNLLSTLKEDSIGRNKDVYRFAYMLTQLQGATSIALEGKWGSGKTFFVKQTKMVLDSLNPNLNILPPEDRDVVQEAIEKYIDADDILFAENPHVSVYFDAWLNDNATDPVLSLIYEILQTAENGFLSNHVTADLLKLAGAIADVVTGKRISNFFEAIKKSDNPLGEICKQHDLHDMVARFLDSLVPERGNRLVVFVDELDRCNPSFAVQLLERIKHYFSNERITFVFSVNLYELQHTVRCYYGNDFDACRYLERFFNLRVSLPLVDNERFLEYLGVHNSVYVYDEVCKAVVSAHKFELREIIQFYKNVSIAAHKPACGNYTPSFSFEKANSFCMTVLVPIMVGLKMSDSQRYDDFIKGRDGTPFVDLFSSGEIAKGYGNMLLNQDETYGASYQPKIQSVKRSDKLMQVYQAVFTQSYTNGKYCVDIGEMQFTAKTRELVMRCISLLSDYADYSLFAT